MILLSVFVLTSADALPSTKRSSFRFFFLIAGLFSFMFVSAFNLFLTSLLSTQTTILPFKTVDDIAEDGTYSICMNPESTVVSRFGDSKWNKILNNNECPKREQFLPESGLNLLEYICEKKVVMGIGGVSKG